MNLAQRMGVPSVAILLHAPVAVCLQRVGARRGHEGGIEGTGAFATGVVTRMTSDLKPVKRAEGFTDLCEFSHQQPPHLVAADILLRFGLPLLPNWVPLREQSTGRLYYGNALTRETTWNRPSVAPVPRHPPPAPAQEAATQKLWVGNLHPLADKRYAQAQPLKAHASRLTPVCSWLLSQFQSFGRVTDAFVVMDTRQRPSVSKVNTACLLPAAARPHVRAAGLRVRGVCRR